MIGAFSTALGSALTSFVADISTAVGDNATKIIPLSLGLVGIFVLWRVVKKLASSR